MDKQKILVVEDDQFIREVYLETLTDAGFVVETAVDGQDGLTKASAGGYSLILLDMIMPNMNGLEFLDAIKQKPPLVANGPIILLTNLTQDPIIAQGLQKGAKDCLVKSEMNPDELVTNVKKFLS